MAAGVSGYRRAAARLLRCRPCGERTSWLTAIGHLTTLILGPISSAAISVPAMAPDSSVQAPPAAVMHAVASLKLTADQAKACVDKKVYGSDDRISAKLPRSGARPKYGDCNKCRSIWRIPGDGRNAGQFDSGCCFQSFAAKPVRALQTYNRLRRWPSRTHE
jgi:hypothetical protein